MFIFQSAFSYLFSYKISLLQADLNKYIYTRIFTIFKLSGTDLIFLLLFLTWNYLVFLTAIILLVIITDAYASDVVDREYPYFDRKACPS